MQAADRPDPADFAGACAPATSSSGYWITLDAPFATERVARLGYDYVAIDAQHGLLGHSGSCTGCSPSTAAGPPASSASRPTTRPPSATRSTRAPGGSSSRS